MAKEYKTLEFPNHAQGQRDAEEAINKYAKEGWILKSRDIASGGWSFWRTCCLGIVFLPLALLGRNVAYIHIVLERDVTESEA